jgi:hypothetical protein
MLDMCVSQLREVSLHDTGKAYLLIGGEVLPLLYVQCRTAPFGATQLH